jgi:hypothetical protein
MVISRSHGRLPVIVVTVTSSDNVGHGPIADAARSSAIGAALDQD